MNIKKTRNSLNVGVQGLVQRSQPRKAIANTECLQTITIKYKISMESTINFKRSSLAGFQQISEPGKYKVQVLNNVTDRNLVESASGRQSYIVSLKAIFPDKLEQLKQVFAESEEVAIEQTNGLFATGNIWKNSDETPALPMKGEEIEATVAYVPSRDGEEVLRVTNMRVLGAKVAKKLSLEGLFATAPSAVITH